MKRILFLALLSLLPACSIIGKKKMAALNVTSSPKVGIFLDGEHIGSTPYYDDKLKPGEYSIRLVPENSTMMPWEARIKLSPGILTVVSRELADTFDLSSGHILSLEPDMDKEKTSMLIVTTPEGAVINVDGEPKGFSPLSVEGITPGDHVLSISSPGSVEKSIKARLEKGYKLTASIQLAKSPQLENLEKNISSDDEEKTTEEDLGENSESEENETKETKEKILDDEIDEPREEDSNQVAEKRKPAGQDLKPPFVTIQETSTGWLNVREEPSTASKIIIKIYPGDAFKYLDSTKTGWYQIELDDKKKGWISSKYAKLTEE